MSYVRILNESNQCESWIGPRSDQGRIVWSAQGDWILWIWCYYLIWYDVEWYMIWYDIDLWCDIWYGTCKASSLVSRYLQVYPSKSRHCHDDQAVLRGKTKVTIISTTFHTLYSIKAPWCWRLRWCHERYRSTPCSKWTLWWPVPG